MQFKDYIKQQPNIVLLSPLIADELEDYINTDDQLSVDKKHQFIHYFQLQIRWFPTKAEIDEELNVLINNVPKEEQIEMCEDGLAYIDKFEDATIFYPYEISNILQLKPVKIKDLGTLPIKH